MSAAEAHDPGDDPPYDAEADAIGSYNDAVKAIGERVKAGQPIPDLFLPKGEACGLEERCPK